MLIIPDQAIQLQFMSLGIVFKSNNPDWKLFAFLVNQNIYL